jgi:hypothetical protein
MLLLNGFTFLPCSEDKCEGSCPSEWCNNGEAVVISGRAGSVKQPPRAV